MRIILYSHSQFFRRQTTFFYVPLSDTVGYFLLNCRGYSTIIRLFVKSLTLNPQQAAQSGGEGLLYRVKICYMNFYLKVLRTQPTLCLITPFFLENNIKF